ncbi:hypothetical protein FB558_2278 [Pseudonocardia kunmingensis]|uniref:MFS transporter n=2 Tax=Pseudonocardia kunmingensis TaxID=630975 RepID=A0A543E1N2_9PSEU|nr:hypothetical protein FB558_2278 [Pseudonocardia kunmingensis]
MPVSALGIDMIVGAAPPGQAGSAAAVGETTQELGGALGIALIGSLVTTIYHRRMSDAVPEVVRSAAPGAVDTLAGALAAAGRLPGSAGSELVSTARAAFTDGLQLTAAIAIPLLVVLAVVSVALLRQVRPHVGPPADEPVPWA